MQSFDDLTSKLGHATATIPSSRFCKGPRLVTCRRRQRTSFCVVVLFPLIAFLSCILYPLNWTVGLWIARSLYARILVRYTTLHAKNVEMHFQAAVAKIELPLPFICKAALPTRSYKHFDVKLLPQMQGRIACSCERFYLAAARATCRRG
jgi:hypothetical protein